MLEVGGFWGFFFFFLTLISEFLKAERRDQGGGQGQNQH